MYRNAWFDADGADGHGFEGRPAQPDGTGTRLGTGTQPLPTAGTGQSLSGCGSFLSCRRLRRSSLKNLEAAVSSTVKFEPAADAGARRLYADDGEHGADQRDDSNSKKDICGSRIRTGLPSRR
jgi:hypothetical protein